MNITIGIKASPRELDLEVNLSEDELFAQVSEALRAQTPLLLTDTKGEKTLIPATEPPRRLRHPLRSRAHSADHSQVHLLP